MRALGGVENDDRNYCQCLLSTRPVHDDNAEIVGRSPKEEISKNTNAFHVEPFLSFWAASYFYVWCNKFKVGRSSEFNSDD